MGRTGETAEMIAKAEEPPSRYTAHQVARGARADAETATAYYLFKCPTVLHATYQIRLLSFLAATRGKKLVIQVPKQCRKGESLARLIKEHAGLINFERV